MESPNANRLQFTPDLNICRILNGMWQLSGANGRINPKQAIACMFDYLEAGYTTWDLADHYGPAEEFIGEFHRQLRQQGDTALETLQAFTKWVPRPAAMTRRVVEENINRSLQRMDVPTLDLLQLHWWEYRDPNYLDALKHLTNLQTEGKIKHLALTNFDTEHLKLILDNGIKIVSNQVQYSLVDRRPQVQMTELCQQYGVQLLTYGSLCGGFLSASYLGRSEPRGGQLETVSLRKYKQIIDAWGSWGLFQELLLALQDISQRHGASISNIAVRYILDQPVVAGVIVGARLGISQHLDDNARAFTLKLESADRDQIDAVLGRSRNLFQLIGDCGDEYRR